MIYIFWAIEAKSCIAFDYREFRLKLIPVFLAFNVMKLELVLWFFILLSVENGISYDKSMELNPTWQAIRPFMLFIIVEIRQPHPVTIAATWETVQYC